MVGPGPQIYDNCFAGGPAEPGHTFCGPGRAGPGPGLIIQFAGRAWAGSAQQLRARAASLGINFRPVQGPT